MTKTNKTLLCVLLAMVLAFALAFVALTTTAQTATAEGETADYTLTGSYFASAYPTTETTITIDSNFSISVLYAATFDNGKTIQLKSKTGYIKFNKPIAKIKLTSASNVSVVDGSSTITGSNGEYTFSSGEAVQIKAGSSVGKITKIEVWLAASHTCTAVEGADWVKGETGHYHECSDPSCPVTDETKKPDYAPHTYGEWTVDTSANKATRECTVCHKVEETTDLSVNVFVNGTIMKSSGTPTERSAEVKFGTKTVTVKITSDEEEIAQDELLTVEFGNEDNNFNKANYNVTVEGGEFDWEDEKSGYLTVGNVKEVNITIVYICSHANQSYEHIPGSEKHKVVCAECGVTLVEEEACVANGENVATCMKAGKCDLCNGAIAKLAHGSKGCTHTAEEIIVLKAYDLENGATLGEYTLTGVYRVVSNKYYLEVGSLSDKRIMLYKGKLAAGSETPVDGDTITVTGTIKNYNGTIEFDTPMYSKVTVVASKFKVSQSITVGDGAKEAPDEVTGIRTIYVKNGSQIVVTYAITENGGVNTFIATLKYNKDLFSIVSVTITDGFGANAAIKSGNVSVDDYKVYIEGDGDGYTADYTGEFVTVVYQFNGDTTATINASEFGLDEVTCYTNHASDFVDAETTIGTSNEVFDVIKQASITLNDQEADSQIEVTYNAKELTVDLALNNPTLVVKSESTGKLVCKWYSDTARANEIAAPTNVGTYYLTVTIEATPAYEQSTANFTIVINPYQIDYDALSVSANPNDKALVGGTATWAEGDIVVGGLAGLPDATGVYTITYGTLSFDTVGEKEISVIVTITNANYKFVSANEFAEGDSQTVYNGKATVSVSAKAISLSLPTLADKYYDGVAISLAGIAASVEGESLTVSVEVTVNGTVITSDKLATYIINAGTYNIAVRAWVEGNDNYKQVTGNLSVEIKKLTLFIDASKIVYSGSIVSWEAVTKAYKANDTELVDIADLGVTVTYQVTNGEGHDYDGSTSFDANTLTTVAQLTLKAIPSDTTNFNVGSQGLKMVYQVLFAASTEPAVAESKVNVFEGEVVSAPSVSAEGYRFDAWYNGEEAYNFATPVETNLTLVAKWVKQITITWYNEDGTSVLKTATADVNTTAKFDLEEPTKAATDHIDYAFAKWVDTTDATKLYDLANEFTLTADISVKATFIGTVARMSVSYKVMDGKGNEGAEIGLGIKAVGALLADLGLPTLTTYKWFDLSDWMNGESVFKAVEADELTGEHKIVLVATYKFNVGLGDVDGNGNVEVADIVLYRKHIVGGYDITVVADAWTTATAEGFDESKVYFLAQVANVDEDASSTNDVRDVSTIRMALVGGYGYTTENGAVVKGSAATTQSAKVQYKQVLAPMGLFGKKFAL